MKTILVPTDYSETAGNALQYAIQLAKITRAKIILLHVYQQPLPMGDVPIALIPPGEIIQGEQVHIDRLKETILGANPGEISIETALRTGFVRQQIIEVAEDQHVDLIVMGMTGSNVDVIRMMGNVTTGVFKKTRIPVLVIPKDTTFHAVKKIALAHDRKTELHAETVQTIKFYTDLFKAELVVVNVSNPFSTGSEKELQSPGQIEQALGGLPRSIVVEEEENIAEGLGSFVDDEHCDWLVMIPHLHRSAIDGFHQSATKQTAFDIGIPLLAIHD